MPHRIDTHPDFPLTPTPHPIWYMGRWPSSTSHLHYYCILVNENKLVCFPPHHDCWCVWCMSHDMHVRCALSVLVTTTFHVPFSLFSHTRCVWGNVIVSLLHFSPELLLTAHSTPDSKEARLKKYIYIYFWRQIHFGAPFWFFFVCFCKTAEFSTAQDATRHHTLTSMMCHTHTHCHYAALLITSGHKWTRLTILSINQSKCIDTASTRYSHLNRGFTDVCG